MSNIRFEHDQIYYHIDVFISDYKVGVISQDKGRWHFKAISHYEEGYQHEYVPAFDCHDLAEILKRMKQLERSNA